MGESCLRFDCNNKGSHFNGLGTQIWSGDKKVADLLADWNVRVVRMDVGEIDVTAVSGDRFADYLDHYQDSKYNHFEETANILNPLNIKVVVCAFGPPDCWMKKNVVTRRKTLRNDCYGPYGTRMAAAIRCMKDRGLDVIGVEPFNEPDGAWDCYLTPQEYNNVIIIIREELVKHGLEDVKVYGPGLAHIDHGKEEPWVNNLSQKAVESIGVWSCHAYQWEHEPSKDPRSLRNHFELLKPHLHAKDTGKEICITEFSPLKVWEKDKKLYPTVYATNAFGARTVEEALSIIAHGANHLMFWEAADMDWATDRLHGAISLEGTKKPVYHALQSVFSVWPTALPDGRDVRVLSPDPRNDNASCYGVVVTDDTNHEICVTIVNSGDKPQKGTIQLENNTCDAIIKATKYEDGRLIRIPPEKWPQIEDCTGSFAFALKAHSCLTVSLQDNTPPPVPRPPSSF